MADWSAACARLIFRALGEYCALLQSDRAHEEMSELVNAITTNLTGFFREAHHFDHLKEALGKIAQPGHLRLWSSACSSGMEPYSMAMTLRDAIPGIDKWDAKILATDIDSNMVQTGRTGIYNADDVKTVPAAYRKFMSAKDGGKAEMDESLKRLTAFRELNLLREWPMKGKFDIVFCRNVIIYFDVPTKQKLFDRMADAMKPDGLLYIGHSENLTGVSDRFKLIGRTIYRRIK